MSFDFDSVKDILVCPKSHAELVQEGDSLVSTDPQTRLRYKVVDDIPILIVEDAVELNPEEWSAVMRRHQRDPQTGRALGAEGNAAAADGAGQPGE